MNYQQNIFTASTMNAASGNQMDIYFSADIETDGPIPGPFSMLSFGIVYAGCFDGQKFIRPNNYNLSFYRKLQPISNEFEIEALKVNGLDRQNLITTGTPPEKAMTEAADWIKETAGVGGPVLVAYPLSFDWSWLYWYFIKFNPKGSPFKHSRCFDIKTAFAVKGGVPISDAGMSNLPDWLKSRREHSHDALEDAIEQAEIFANIFEWNMKNDRA